MEVHSNKYIYYEDRKLSNNLNLKLKKNNLSSELAEKKNNKDHRENKKIRPEKIEKINETKSRVCEDKEN